MWTLLVGGACGSANELCCDRVAFRPMKHKGTKVAHCKTYLITHRGSDIRLPSMSQRECTKGLDLACSWTVYIDLHPPQSRIKVLEIRPHLLYYVMFGIVFF